MKRIPAWWIGGALLVSAAAWAQVPDALEGTWVTDDTTSVDEAVDEAVRQLPFWKRPFARTQLRSVTSPCSSLEILELGDQLSITCDDRVPAVQVPGSGPGEHVDEYDNTFVLAMQLQDGEIVQTFTTEDGSRTNIYSRQGDQLVLDVVVSSPRLPEDVTYTRTFEPRPLAPGV